MIARDETMLTNYIDAAMRNSKYKILSDGTFYGEIPTLQGVWANADTLEECRTELQSVLEGWIILGLQFGDPIPNVSGVSLRAKERAM